MNNETQQPQNYNNITVTSHGLKCDQPECDWKDMTISHADDNLVKYIGMPCPKCGHNVLTEVYYQNITQLLEYADFINSLSPEQIQQLEKEYGPVIPGMFQGEIELVVFDTHEKISIAEITYKEPTETNP